MKKGFIVFAVLIGIASVCFAGNVYRKTEKINLQDTLESLRTVTANPKAPWTLKWVGVAGYALHDHEINETVNVYVNPAEGDSYPVLIKTGTFSSNFFEEEFDIPLLNDTVTVVTTKPTGDTTATIRVSIRGER